MLPAGAALEVIDPEGEQVADLAVFLARDPNEYFSAGRTIDYNERIALTAGDTLYSAGSIPLLRIEEDDVGTHDLLVTPCSERMFELMRGMRNHPSCLANLRDALAPHGIPEVLISSTFNIFMDVRVSADGRITIGPPPSRAGDGIVFRALEDLVIGLTACSSEFSNAGRCKPIGYRVIPEA